MTSVNDKLERVRKPRVHIKYEVETEDAVLEKELPFVVGVLGDYSGDATEPLKSVKDRKFTQIDRDNFDEVMRRQNAGLNIRVKNSISGDDSELALNLKFNEMADFEPENVVNQIPALKELKDARDKLRDLLSKSDRSEALEKILEDALQDSSKLSTLAKDLGIVNADKNKET